MNDKDKIEVKTKTNVVVQKTKGEDIDISKSLEEHMEDNRKNVNTKIDYKTIFMYLIMVIILAVGILLLLHFCEKSVEDLNKKKSTTTHSNYQLLTTTSVSTQSVEYIKTEAPQTRATHTVFVPNAPRPTNTNELDRTNVVITHTTKSKTKLEPTTSITSATTKESTTEKVESNREGE